MKNESQGKIIAVCGKGGVGKTLLTATMAKLLADRGNIKILAIDADPSFGLAPALGVKVKRTIDDIRNDLIKKVKKGQRGNKSEMAAALDYEVFDALEEGHNLGVLAIGRPENKGCYCQVNELLKEVIGSLSESFDVVLIDGEAGIEQINRRVMRSVDDLVIVSDTSSKGINVAGTIRHVAQDRKAVKYTRIGLVINRVRRKEEVDKILEVTSLDLLGWIPEDDIIREYDFNGKPMIELPDDSSSVRAVQEILKKLMPNNLRMVRSRS